MVIYDKPMVYLELQAGKRFEKGGGTILIDTNAEKGSKKSEINDKDDVSENIQRRFNIIYFPSL